MDVIYKYGPLQPGDEPYWITGDPVKFSRQNGWPGAGQLYCWCVVSLNENGVVISPTQKVRVIPTGEKYRGFYLDSYIEENGLVWHLITA